MLESCEPNDDLLLAIQELHQKGYTLALDDFIPTAEWNRFLPFVHIIKFDIRATPIAKAGFFIRRHREQGSKLLFLAEKVETYDEYQAAKQAGFDLFQGFFFSRPEMVQRKTLNPYALTTLRLFSEISQPVVDFDKVERIIASDVSLSYKLLHHVNCMTYTRAKPISSFKQALVYLGEEKLRHFITFVATAHVMEDKPMSLYHLSLQRAWFCERLSMNFPGQIDKNQAFLTGLFSLLDSILDQPIEVLVEQLPLPAQVHQALIKQQGHLGGVLRLVKAYDEANWPQVQRLCQLLGLDESIVAERYMESLKWSADFEQNMPKN